MNAAETVPTVALDKQTRALLDKINADTPIYTLPIAQARDRLEKGTLSSTFPSTEVHSVEDRTIPGPNGVIPVRIYRSGPARAHGRYPVLVLFHGGGFVLGSINSHDNLARYYCSQAGLIVISVAYRLAPEHKFPAGVEDAYAALCWAGDHAAQMGGDAARMAVIGDSAGGNFAAVVCQLARLRKGPNVAYQVLLYPAMTSILEADYPSRKLYGNGEYLLSRAFKKWRGALYFNQADVESRDPRASPILTKDLSGLPQTLIVTAEFDMLRDEARHYARRLIESDVPVEYKNYPTTIHGFISFAGALDVGKEALKYVSDRLKLVLA